MMTLRFKKQNDFYISEHFKAMEFDCPCDQCDRTLIGFDLLKHLELLRTHLGCPIHINSGYRCLRHQLELQSKGYETVKQSQHLLGFAADISTGKHTGLELEKAAREIGLKTVGVASAWVHIDERGLDDGVVRRWTYNS